MSGDGGRRSLPPVRKRFGQHFLHHRRTLGRIADALGARTDETVVEIGPGRGALTDLLRQRARRIVAIEVDRALAALLAERYADDPHVQIVQGDVLRCTLGDLAGGPFALVGNIPYNITTPIVFHALRHPRPTRAVFLVQREVAERMTASPGGKEYGALSVNLQAVASVRRLFVVPASAFSPPPRVQSAVVEVRPLERPVVRPDEEAPFREFVQAIFGMRRKQMRRVLLSLARWAPDRAESALNECEIRADARPETIPVERLARLFRGLRDGR